MRIQIRSGFSRLLPSAKLALLDLWSTGCGQSKPRRRGEQRGLKPGSEVVALRSGSPTHHPTHVDEIVGDHAEGNPTLHSGVGFVPAAVSSSSRWPDLTPTV